MARNVLDLIFRTRKEGTAAAQVAQDLGQAGAAAESTGLRFKTLEGIAFDLGRRINEMAINFAKSIPEMGELAIQADRGELALLAYAGSSEEAARATQAVLDATGGAVSEFAAAQNAARLYSMGLASTSDEVGKLAEMAVTLGAAMGKDAQGAFEDFSLLLANQSIPRLDTFGISASAVRERIAELQAETDGLDRSTAFMIATMEIGQQRLDELAETGFEVASSYEVQRANIEQLRVEIGEYFNLVAGDGVESVATWTSALTFAVQAENELLAAVERGVLTQEEANELINKATWTSFTFAEALAVLEERELALQPVTVDASLAIDGWAEAASRAALAAAEGEIALDGWEAALITSTSAAEEETTALDALKLSIIGVGEAAIARVALQELENALEEGRITTEAYNLAIIEIRAQMMGMPAEQLIASQAMQQLTLDFQAGLLTAEQYVDAVRALGNEINSLPLEKDIDIRVNFEGVGGPVGGIEDELLPGAPVPALQHGGRFRVTGPPGIDNVPVFFMATPGEQVTVTPAGAAPAGGEVFQNFNLHLTVSEELARDVQQSFGLLEALAGI